MKTATLPDLPTGKEFEEFLAAFLQNSFYVERNIVDRQEEEVLELDIIGSSYEKDKIPSTSLYEVKSGAWGFVEIFKIRGWLDYLNLDSGCLLVLQERAPLEFYKKIASSLNVSIITIPDIDNTGESLKELIQPEGIDKVDIGSWRFSYWTERQLLRLLTVKKKSVGNKECYKALDRYFQLINNRTFFTQNIVERAYKLYDSFREYPHISAKMGHELHGAEFGNEYDSIPKALYSEAYYDCVLNDLAISTFIEHRARLAVLRSAIDYTIYKNTGSDQNRKLTFQFGTREVEYSLLDLLPQSFKSGLAEISEHEYFHRYPIFWQWFLWIFGGFVLMDYQTEDYTLMSEKTGIPVTEIPRAINAYEILFPRSDGWFIEPPHSNVRMLKLFPTPFMGVGSNYRRLRYAASSKWEELKLTGLHTLDDLIKWNNVVVELLTNNY